MQFINPTRTGLFILWLYSLLLKTNTYRVEKYKKWNFIYKKESGTDSILVETKRLIVPEPVTGSIIRIQYFVYPTRTGLLFFRRYSFLLKTNTYRVEKQIMKFSIP